MLNKIDKPLASLTKKNWKNSKQIKLDEKGDTKIETTETQRSIRNNEELYANKLENLKEMDKFLDSYNPPILNQKDII